MSKEKLRRLIDLSVDCWMRAAQRLPFDAADELMALRAEFEAWAPEFEAIRLRSALAVVADRLARWLHLPTGTRLADLRQFVDDALVGDRESKG